MLNKEAIMDDFNKAVATQWNNGSPYWPDWDGVREFIADLISRSNKEIEVVRKEAWGTKSNPPINLSSPTVKGVIKDSALSELERLQKEIEDMIQEERFSGAPHALNIIKEKVEKRIAELKKNE